VTSGGQPVVLDLGLALALAIDRGDGDLVGTPAYLAPEQASGRACDARADVYAVGVMLYEALSGRMPHEQSSVDDLLRAKISERPLPLAERAPDVPHYVCAAVDQMLDPRPAQRPGSARAAAELLHNQRRVFSLPWAGSRGARRRPARGNRWAAGQWTVAAHARDSHCARAARRPGVAHRTAARRTAPCVVVDGRAGAHGGTPGCEHTLVSR
jgi:serine/threonine protein kinase